MSYPLSTPPSAQPIPGDNWHMRLKTVDSIGNLNDVVTGINSILSPGITATIALAKLTTGGTNGSITVTRGIVTAYTAPT